jgi:hypothetical protein
MNVEERREQRFACEKEATKVVQQFSSNSDMQIGVPAEYCTTQNAKLVPNESNFQHWVS